MGADALTTVHHIGVTVADLDHAIAFWEALLERSARDRRQLEGPNLGVLVGYPGVRMDSCWFDLPGGMALELLEYLDRDDEAYDPGTAHPGNVHVCLRVDDMDTAHRHAIACGARPVSDAPIEIPTGPKAGTRIAYVREPNGVTIELFQPPAG